MPFDQNALAHPGYVAPANPLEMASNAVAFKNALLGNKIQQAEYDARMAQGAAYAHHYNPLSGRYDMPAVQQEMGSTAAGQYGLPEAVTTIRSQQAQQIGNDQAQLELNGRRMGMIAGIVSPYANRPNLTKRDLAPAYGAAIAHGIMSIDQANQSYAALPEGGDALKQQVRGLLDSAAGPGHAYNDAYGTMQLVDDGGTLRWQNVGSPASGQGGQDVGAGVQRQTSPEFNHHLVPVEDARGNPVLKTQAVIEGKPTVPPSVMGDGSYRASANSQEGYAAGPSPGQVDAQKATAAASAGGANALMQAASQRNERLGMLSNLSTDLSGFQSGGGYSRLRKMAAIVNNVSPYQFDEDGIEAAQSFDKWAQNLANAQATALGHSDARLAAAEHASPNSALQEGTNRMMIHQLMGNEDAINAKANAWKASGLPPAQYQTWEQSFNQSFDPRAFQILRMDPAERQKVFKGMRDSGQMDEFKQTYNRMAAAGLVPSGR
ncbi:hypothetical protein [Kozakia baliensis]|uniref:hypothetical protein n=1 Tax=Kozakia baliensis TaxID=153496 RepID=UPI000495543D|nr:hypothetical protein [Kozakia baliensis]